MNARQFKVIAGVINGNRIRANVDPNINEAGKRIAAAYVWQIALDMSVQLKLEVPGFVQTRFLQACGYDDKIKE